MILGDVNAPVELVLRSALVVSVRALGMKKVSNY